MRTRTLWVTSRVTNVGASQDENVARVLMKLGSFVLVPSIR
jgi:hypothetical protein